MSNGTATATMPTYLDDQLSSSFSSNGPLSNSLGSLTTSASRSHQASQIAKTYRQAGQLFLTRRLPEALSTIEPIITPEQHEANGHHPAAAPISSASRGARIKVWGFYLTFLNAVVDLGPEEGKHAFGSTKWKQLVNKARDGTVWEDIVQVGYNGIEGNVDGDVVINLWVTRCRALMLGRANHTPEQLSS
jgi:hypothetical protein